MFKIKFLLSFLKDYPFDILLLSRYLLQLRFVRCEIAQRVAERRATQKNRRVRCLGNECNSIATRFF